MSIKFMEFYKHSSITCQLIILQILYKNRIVEHKNYTMLYFVKFA